MSRGWKISAAERLVWSRTRRLLADTVIAAAAAAAVLILMGMDIRALGNSPGAPISSLSSACNPMSNLPPASASPPTCTVCRLSLAVA